MEDVLYKICDGNFTKFPSAKKMKVSEAGIYLLLKEKENFLQWWVNEQTGEY